MKACVFSDSGYALVCPCSGRFTITKPQGSHASVQAVASFHSRLTAEPGNRINEKTYSLHAVLHSFRVEHDLDGLSGHEYFESLFHI